LEVDDEVDDEDEDEDEEPEVMVFASSASNFDDELEHRKAPTVMASEATDAVLPSLKKVAPFAAVKGAPKALVAALVAEGLADGGRVVDAGCDGLLGSREELVEGDGDLDRGVAVAGLD
jgi:hypothetical protein